MPLYISEKIDKGTRLLAWKITEPLEELSEGVGLKDVCVAKVHKMKSEQHRKGFMSVRRLMEAAGYTDFDLYYDCNGKPHLKDGNTISITHSYSFSAIIISDKNSGIDMEMQRKKVITIAGKFCEKEFAYLDSTHVEPYMHMLIVIWGVKEAIYKMMAQPGLSFKKHIEVLPFKAGTSGEGKARVTYSGMENTYTFHYKEIDGFTLVYCLDN